MSFRLALLFCTLALLCRPPAWCAEVPFSITISMTPDVVKTGSEARLNIVYTNISDHKVDLLWIKGGASGELFGRIQIWDDRGTPVGLSKFGRTLMGRDVTPQGPGPYYLPRDYVGGMIGIMARRILPGKTIEDAIVLSKVHDLSLPGKYTVQVERFDEITKTFVKSNKIAITVTE
jgi:hypothetical protein